MPVVLTDPYMSKTFYVPLTLDKSEGFWARPVTETDMTEYRRQCGKEAGGDEDLMNSLILKRILMDKVVDWQGYRDAAGQDLPCTPEVKAAICVSDPVHVAEMVLRIRNIARMGMVDDAKN